MGRGGGGGRVCGVMGVGVGVGGVMQQVRKAIGGMSGFSSFEFTSCVSSTSIMFFFFGFFTWV